MIHQNATTHLKESRGQETGLRSESRSKAVTRTLTIASNVTLSGANPYLQLFYSALHLYGVQFAGTFQPTLTWLHQLGPDIGAVHFHWPEFFVRRYPPSLQRIYQLRSGGILQRMVRPQVMWANVRKLRKFVAAAHRGGKRIIWTVHNVEPHESNSAAERAAFRILGQYADLLICHDANAARQVTMHYPTRGKVVVMPHGNYEGAFPTPGPADETRRRLELDPKRPLLACIGNIRDYKGYDLAVEAAGLLGDSVQLLIAGKPVRYDIDALENLAANRPNVKLIRERLSPENYADFSHTADLILLPYRNITGSGALLSAVTFGRSVVASDLPYFHDILEGNREAGVLFEPGNPQALARAIRTSLTIPAERRTAAAFALADQFAWDRVVEPVVEVVRQWKQE